MVRIGSVLAVPAAAVAVIWLGKTFHQLADEYTFWVALLAMAGATALLFPALFFRWDAPRWWFAGERPKPSASYLALNRFVGTLMLLGSVLLALTLPAPPDETCGDSSYDEFDHSIEQEEC